MPSMSEVSPGLTIEELAARANVSVRTVRYYIAQGLLPGPGARGKAATYGNEHLVRLQLIRRLVDQRVPLGEIQGALARLSLDETRDLLSEEDQRAELLREASQAPSPKDYVATLLRQAQSARKPTLGDQVGRVPPRSSSPPIRGLQHLIRPGTASSGDAWRRWELAPGVELHIRADAEYQQRELIEQLLRFAGQETPERDP
jgi:DNA-binding transcriptional MerR regulator